MVVNNTAVHTGESRYSVILTYINTMPERKNTGFRIKYGMVVNKTFRIISIKEMLTSL